MVRRFPNQNEPASPIEAARRSLEEFGGTHGPEDVAGCCLALGIQMEQANEFEVACEFYARGIELHPRSGHVRYFLNNNIGYSLNQLRRFTEAEPYCRAAIEVEGRRHNAYKNLGVSLTGQKRYAEAAVHFVQATRACPGDRRALRCLERLVIEAPEILSLVPNLQEDLEDCRTLDERSSSASMN